MEKQLEPIIIYGDAVRGNNANRHGYAHKWHDFLEKYGVNNFNSIYALYYNYESDCRGDFDFVIGMTWDSGSPAHKIEGGKYYVWDVGSDDPMDVPDAWEDIWASDLKLAYKTDFELYVPGESTKIYVSIKE